MAIKKKKTKSKMTKTKKALSANRREHKRLNTKNLWLVKRHLDHEFLVKIKNISLGGLFALGTVKLNSDLVSLRLPLGSSYFEVDAAMVHDKINKNEIGTGYAFVFNHANQKKLLTRFLRQLN